MFSGKGLISGACMRFMGLYIFGYFYWEFMTYSACSMYSCSYRPREVCVALKSKLASNPHPPCDSFAIFCVDYCYLFCLPLSGMWQRLCPWLVKLTGPQILLLALGGPTCSISWALTASLPLARYSWPLSSSLSSTSRRRSVERWQKFSTRQMSIEQHFATLASAEEKLLPMSPCPRKMRAKMHVFSPRTLLQGARCISWWNR